MQWAAIFHKRHVRFTTGLEYLVFYNSHGLTWSISTQTQPTTKVERSVLVTQTFL
ncbi:hypothetical protein [Desulfobacter curvatus]|uniref:hypothetical protein n=1 Tax=Desulfobacter curvatus TaxID=2290 RepID=UPI001FDF1CAA|nr:hypothetical protein [Desulfobacter curvatus]